MAFPATAVRFPGAAQRVNGDGAVRPATSRSSRRHSIRDITAGRRACTRPSRTGRRQLPVARKVQAHPSLILRHSKIAITMEIYTMVPDKATLAALKRLSDALSSPDAALPDDAE